MPACFSSSWTEASLRSLNSLPDGRAFQSHFLGEAAFQATLQRLMDPGVPDYFFEHSAGRRMVHGHPGEEWAFVHLTEELS